MHRVRQAFAATCATVAVVGIQASFTVPAAAVTAVEAAAIQRTIAIDRSGRRRVGDASYYHQRFDGRTMANGEPFDADGINAASKTLPLGTVARVTNLENGRSAVVRIDDRGPYVAGRIIDLSPRTAGDLGMRHQGVVRVEVVPITVPLPDGSVRIGDAGKAAEKDTAASGNPS
jgi:rare lipoprotein A